MSGEPRDWSEERPAHDDRGDDARSDHRDPDRDQRQSQRDQRHAEREARWAERSARRAERAARRHLHFQTHGIGIGVDPDEIARSVSSAFLGDDVGGETHEETVERTFAIDGMARLRVNNVSGETNVRTGPAGEVKVVARKVVRGTSADRAKRLLENVELRIEQQGNEVRVAPRLYEQERGWLDMFRGPRFRVDFEITVPRECGIEAQTVSGDLSIAGTRGPLHVGSVSGEVELSDVQGPLRLKTVSGDVDCRDYVGHVEGSSVSGDVTIRPARVRSIRFESVSGDLSIEGELEAGQEHRLKTISGDVELALASPSATIEFRTNSGDVTCDIVGARIVREGRKDKTIVLGEGRARVSVKSVSGDLTITSAFAAADTASNASRPEPASETMTADVERTEPMPPPAGTAVRAVLERLARGELSVEDAAAELDAARGR